MSRASLGSEAEPDVRGRLVGELHLGRLDKAVPLLEVALAGKERVRSTGGVAVLLENLGVAELARGDEDAADAYFQRAFGVAVDPHTLATLHVQLARLALARGRQDLAREHMDEASALWPFSALPRVAGRAVG